MFDLDLNLRAWRDQSARKLDAPLLDELEAHLRDQFDALRAEGKTPEDAWAMALARLGDARQLAAEFRRADARFWIPGWATFGSLAILLSLLGFFIATRPLHQHSGLLMMAHVFCITAGYLTVLAMGLLGAWCVVSRAFSGWSTRQDTAFRATGAHLALFASIATGAGLILGACWAHQHLGRWWGWDVREVGGLCALAWALILLHGFWSRSATTQSRFTLSIIGNAVIATAWFGALYQTGTHAYGSMASSSIILSSFILSQILILHVMLLPEGKGRGGHARHSAPVQS